MNKSKNDSDQSNQYPFPLVASDTFDASLKGMEKLFNEKISALNKRITDIENGEIKRQDRIFKWKTISVSSIISSILGIIVTLIVQKIIN